MTESICFYFPYHHDSGVPVLFYRLANSIALSNSKIQISIIDYENGSMWRNVLPLANIHKIRFEIGKVVSPPEGSILVMQSILPYYWPEELKLLSSQKIFFWNLHPHNLIPSLLPVPFLRELTLNSIKIYHLISRIYPNLLKRMNEFVSILLENNALVFMDKSNLDTTKKYLFAPIDQRQFLPVPADFIQGGPRDLNQHIVNNVVKIAWIGRLCDFKSHILIYAIQKLNQIVKEFDDKQFEFHVVGSGPFELYIKKEIDSCKSVNVIFHGELSHNQIDEFLVNIDIVMAMGTSALEGAKLGIPTILLDPILNPVQGDYIFRKLYDTIEYDLGHFITNDDYRQGNTSFNDILNEILKNYPLESQKSSEYFFANHSLETVKDQFLDKIYKSQLTYSKIDSKHFVKPILLKVYNNFRGLKS